MTDAVVRFIRLEASELRDRAQRHEDDPIANEMEHIAYTWECLATRVERGEHLEDAA